MTWNGSTPASDRIFATLPYLLVLLYGFPFGHALFNLFPALGQLLLPLIMPVAVLYNMIPLAGIVVFLALLLGVVRNDRISHFIRFNTLQALLISIVLFLCEILLSLFSSIPSLTLMVEVLSNTVFLGSVAMFGYAGCSVFPGPLR